MTSLSSPSHIKLVIRWKPQCSGPRSIFIGLDQITTFFSLCSRFGCLMAEIQGEKKCKWWKQPNCRFDTQYRWVCWAGDDSWGCFASQKGKRREEETSSRVIFAMVLGVNGSLYNLKTQICGRILPAHVNSFFTLSRLKVDVVWEQKQNGKGREKEIVPVLHSSVFVLFLWHLQQIIARVCTFVPDCVLPLSTCSPRCWWEAINCPSSRCRAVVERERERGMCVCVCVGGCSSGGVLSVNLCQAICIHNTRGEREREREWERKWEGGDERENLLKGTENKSSGRKNKTHGTRGGQIRWGGRVGGLDGVRKWDERSVREGQGVKVSI